jgi:hypothetical protein
VSLGDLGVGCYLVERAQMRWSGLRRRESWSRKGPMRSPTTVATWDRDHKTPGFDSWADTHRDSHHFEGQQMTCAVHLHWP